MNKTTIVITSRQPAAIISCDCSHAYQDHTYGNKMRVHNAAGSKDKPKFRCTVCSNEKIK